MNVIFNKRCLIEENKIKYHFRIFKWQACVYVLLVGGYDDNSLLLVAAADAKFSDQEPNFICFFFEKLASVASQRWNYENAIPVIFYIIMRQGSGSHGKFSIRTVCTLQCHTLSDQYFKHVIICHIVRFCRMALSCKLSWLAPRLVKYDSNKLVCNKVP